MHLYRSRGHVPAALRRTKLNIPSFEQLGLPAAYEIAIAFTSSSSATPPPADT